MKTVTLCILSTALLLSSPIASADAAADYKKHCASCHAADGSGNTKMGKKSGARDYRDPAVQKSFSDSVALKAIKEGVKKDGKQKMKGYSSKLSDAQMKALVKYIRAFKK